MSLFIPSIPQANDNLDFSQGQLLNNNSGLDTVFGIDHYKFSDATVNKGFHNKVTTPQFFLNSSIPPVYPTVVPATGANPVLYAYQTTDGAGTPTTNTGVLQYSRGPNNAVPTPLTHLHGTAVIAPLGVQNIFDITGITRAMFTVSVMDDVINANNQFAYGSFGVAGAGYRINNFVSTVAPTASKLGITSTGNILEITNFSTTTASTSVQWTIDFLRIL